MTDALFDLTGLPFWKMNGLGNDFVIVDLRRTSHRMTEEAAITLGARDGAYGCDQIITLESRAGEPYMGIWNADGSEAGACGNAARCIGWLLMKESGAQGVAFLTPAGEVEAQWIGNERISVDMGEPRLKWQDIPLAEQMDDTRFIDIKLGPIDNPVLWGPSAVNMGNPHCIFFVDDVSAHQLDKFGPMIEHHPLFPERANISIAQVRGQYDIRLRVWERGAGITRACGTAACAALVAANRRRLTARKASVELDGGTLAIEWRESDDHVIMAGPVELEHQGTLSR
ncbi:diaminopimelate epimerase [Parvularcula sp. IMCC14364]|uniref:diaminopimelate epimerase n=1 Tax=Parvularcula sp. IMCC14364 TaxID=3067902 RepID=UPI002740F34A|nr:diaminopimelate epimerase [Parvularcula sp. IMCC14364]